MRMNDSVPSRLTCDLKCIRLNDCVNTNTCIVYSQARMYFLLQNPVAQKNMGLFSSLFLKAKVDFGGPYPFLFLDLEGGVYPQRLGLIVPLP